MLISNGRSFASIDKHWVGRRIAITGDGRKRDADMAWEQPRNLGCERDGGPNGAGIDSCPNYDDHGHLYFTSAQDGNPANLEFQATVFDEKDIYEAVRVKAKK